MKKKLLILTFLLAPLFLSGCSVLTFNKDKTDVSGVLKSEDFGGSWLPVNKIEGEDDKKIDEVQARKIIIDPVDHNNIFLGTRNGVWFSSNQANSWTKILSSGYVYDMAIDPKRTGIVYVSLGQRVYKTTNLGEKWQSVYFETREDALVNAVEVDPSDSLKVYLGTSEGEIYKTLDGGESWQKMGSFEKAEVKKILVNKNNPLIVYVATKKEGIYKSIDGGASWNNLIANYYNEEDRKKRREQRGREEYRDLILDQSQEDGLIYASEYGLLKSSDGGNIWQVIDLLTPPNSVYINAISTNPKNNNQLYYVTGNILYRSFDGGKTWLSQQLPTKYHVGNLVVDYLNYNLIYAGVTRVKAE